MLSRAQGMRIRTGVPGAEGPGKRVRPPYLQKFFNSVSQSPLTQAVSPTLPDSKLDFVPAVTKKTTSPPLKTLRSASARARAVTKQRNPFAAERAAEARRQAAEPEVKRPSLGKRGKSATEEGKAQRLAQARAGRSITQLTREELEQTDPDKPLTDMAKTMIRYWAQGDSIAAAAARAGYADGASYAYRLVHTPAALKLYDEEKRAYEAASQMTRKRVADGILEGIEMARLLQDPNAFLTGWRDMAKLCGYLDQKERKIKIDLTANITNQRMQGLSDAELLQVIQQGVTQDLARLEMSDGEEG